MNQWLCKKDLKVVKIKTWKKKLELETKLIVSRTQKINVC